tara:strand:+ start:17934 stop:19397 length:1464 start_codon:yes stop_codon:yes gene_type:complete
MSASSKYNLPPDLPLLPVDWIWKPLGELVQEDRGICYGIVQPGKYDENGIPMVNSGNIIDNKSGAEIEFKVSKSVHKKYKRSTLKGGEVLLTLVGANFGRSIVAPKSFVGFNCARPVGVIPVLDSSEYINFALQTPLIRHYMDNWANTTAQPTLNLSDVANLPIAWAPEKQRKIITENIKSLDDKLNNNRKINQTLEQIAQAIFKSWFVDFEPTKAKIAAREALLADMAKAPSPEITADAERKAAIQAISGINGAGDIVLTEQLEALADLFPNQLLDSELGKIPDGWNTGVVGDIAKAKGGYAFKGKDFCDIGSAVIKIKNITGDGTVDPLNCRCINDTIATKAKRFKLEDGDLVMAMTGATVGKIGLMNTFGKSVYLNQRVAKFESEIFGSDVSWFLFCFYSQKETFDIVVSTAQGSAQPNISSTGIESIDLVIPTNDLTQLFNTLVKSLFSKWLLNNEESNSLEQLRDSLLPKLLSGELPLEGHK